MKEFSMEMPNHSETSGERLGRKIVDLIRNTENAIAVEVYGSGIGRLDEDSVTEDQLKVEAAEIYSRYREELRDLLDDKSIQQEVLALFDAFVGSEKTRDELTKDIDLVLCLSSEHTSEVSEHNRAMTEDFEVVAKELPGFLDAKILENQGNRALMSKWGNSKLAYETGDSSDLKAVLEDYVGVTEDVDEKEKVEKFLYFLERQRFSEE